MSDIGRGGSLSVAHVVLSLDCGGLEHVVIDLVRTSRAAGNEATVICLERPGVLAARLESEGTTVLSLGKRPGLRFSTMWRSLRRALREVRPDVVHSHQVGGLLYAGPVAKGFGIPVVHTEHGKHYDSRKACWLGRAAAAAADRFFCVSADIAQYVVDRGVAPGRKVSVVQNGIDVDRFVRTTGCRADVRRELRIPEDSLVLGTVGRLVEVKRQDLLLRAFAALPEHRRESHLVVVGEGPLRADLEGLASELRIAGRVHFTGFRPDRERLLAAMDVFTLTSRSEGMPLSVLEAWAASLPVVVPNVGGLPEIVADGRTGLLINGDDPALWADRFDGLLGDRQTAAAMGRAGFAYVSERFGLQVMANAYDDRYRELLRPGRAHRDGPAAGGAPAGGGRPNAAAGGVA